MKTLIETFNDLDIDQKAVVVVLFVFSPVVILSLPCVLALFATAALVRFIDETIDRIMG